MLIFFLRNVKLFVFKLHWFFNQLRHKSTNLDRFVVTNLVHVSCGLTFSIEIVMQTIGLNQSSLDERGESAKSNQTGPEKDLINVTL